MKRTTLKDVDRAFKALETLDEIKTKITEIRDLWAKNGYYNEADVLALVLRIIDESTGVIK